MEMILATRLILVCALAVIDSRATADTFDRYVAGSAMPVEIWTPSDILLMDNPVEVKLPDRFACWNEGHLNADRHMRFMQFFENDQITQFKADYLSKLLKRESPKILGFTLDSSDFSLATTLKAALDTYSLSETPEISRVFQFFHSSWNHYPVKTLFQDFTRNTSYPLLVGTTTPRFIKPVELYNGDLHNILEGPDTVTIRNSGKFNEAAIVKGMLEKSATPASANEIFVQQSNLLKALWNPKPPTKKLLKGLWCTASQFSNGSYLGLYIPHQKNVASVERAAEISERLLNAAYSLCEADERSCSKNLVVVHENEQIFRGLKFSAGSDFNVMDFKDLLFKSELNLEQYSSPIVEDLLGNMASGYKKRDLWEKRNEEMMLSITILAMAERVVCPMNSSVCQIAALLHGSDSSKFLHDIPLDLD